MLCRERIPFDRYPKSIIRFGLGDFDEQTLKPLSELGYSIRNYLNCYLSKGILSQPRIRHYDSIRVYISLTK